MEIYKDTTYPLPLETICYLIRKHSADPGLTAMQIKTMQETAESAVQQQIIEAIRETDYYKMQNCLEPEHLRNKANKSPIENLFYAYYNSNLN